MGKQERNRFCFNSLDFFKSHFKQMLGFEFAYEILHGAGEAVVQFLPLDSIITLCRCKNTLLFLLNLIPVDFGVADFPDVCGGLTPRVTSCGGAVAVIFRREHLRSGGVQPFNRRFQVPVHNNTAAAPCIAPLRHALPFDEPVAQQLIAADVKAALIQAVDNDPGGGFLRQHHIPGCTALNVGHCREVPVERQLVLTFHNPFQDFLRDRGRRSHCAGVFPTLYRIG